ncbi:MAG: bifunctional phosphoribosyl-AMP cyclohydrolase/phosphoribosyl-ATP diphosphatase HisIE [Eubacteriales bacterium]
MKKNSIVTYKKMIATMYLVKDYAVKSMEDMTPLQETPLELANAYTLDQVDELILHVLSKSDEEKEESLHTIKALAGNLSIPLIGTGGIKRMEDVKKYLYAGCKKAIVPEQADFSLLEEVSKKFGKEKIIACITKQETIEQSKKYEDALCTYASEWYVSKDLVKDSYFTKENAKELSKIVIIEQGTQDLVEQYIKQDGIQGVTGTIIEGLYGQIDSFKKKCLEQGISVESYHDKLQWSQLKVDDFGLLPVVVQDEKTNEVLMLAYMNEEAYIKTLKSKIMTYYSRSRKELWLKGETSGHYQYVKSLQIDCDNDTLLAKVVQVGVACHTGAYSCFYTDIITNVYEDDNPVKVFQEVYDVIMDRKVNPKEGSYTNYLFDKGVDKILKKLGEEATEIVIASKNPNAEEIKYEIADFLYHMMVLMAEKNVTWEEITTELANR